jgi:hypothetical protein
MSVRRPACAVALALFSLSAWAAEPQSPDPVTRGVQRAPWTVVKMDVSPPLREIAPAPIPFGRDKGGLMVDPGPDSSLSLGPQERDGALQDWTTFLRIPVPTASFDGPPNVSGVSPPDPVGDVGPNHIVAMSNLSFQVFDKTGASLFGPAANNTLWAGFGGACQTENAGDPIVLHDQLADRWILTQFTSAGPSYFNCVAISTSPDPTGTYFRYAFSTGTNFPDYPKYGVWPNAYFISTREFAGGGFAGVGAYAVNRAQMIAGNPNPQVVSFVVPPGATPYNIGDGLLPADLDGNIPPPAGSPNYWLGSMDNGGPYGAPQDALNLWKFVVDFTTPANSSFTLTNVLPIAAIDTVYAGCTGRACIPQPATTNRLDILSYRQRPLHRLAYRNFGSHESLVTNQSVETPGPIAGVRWWEVRSPNATPVVFQEGTFSPGSGVGGDGVHRWMGSAAQDSAGNLAIGYSASSATVFPSVRYTGRLASDPLGTLPQGEGEIVAGTGSQTAGGSRWGDYTSLTVDPVDDCTFWHVNEYVPVTSASGWRLRVGAFRFAECGGAGFSLGGTPVSQAICAGTPAVYTVNTGSIAGFAGAVTLAASGQPAGTTAAFAPNPVATPGTSTLTIGNTAGAAAGNYTVTVDGTAAGAEPRSTELGLDIFPAAPPAATLLAPANGAIGLTLTPTLTWSSTPGAQDYLVELATDAGFTNIVFTTVTTGTVANPPALVANTNYWWRVTADNVCGPGSSSAVFTFKTAPGPGACDDSTAPVTLYSENFAGGLGAFTTTGSVGTSTWAISTRPGSPSGGNTVRAVGLAAVSDQRLISPPIALPTGQSPLTLQFWNDQTLEDFPPGACYDGGILEVSSNAGATWTALQGAALLQGAHDGPISAGFTNPLANAPAWCGDPRAWQNYIVDVDAYAGQTVQFRWRLGTDSSVGRPDGWHVDDIRVQGCAVSDVIFAHGFEAVP